MALDRPTSLLPEITTLLCYTSSGGVKKQWEGTCGGGGGGWGSDALRTSLQGLLWGASLRPLKPGQALWPPVLHSRGQLVTR